MANVGDMNDCGNAAAAAEDYLVSGARRGLKREFAFVSSQTELTTPHARTRIQKSSNPLVDDDDDEFIDLENPAEEITINGNTGNHSTIPVTTTDCENGAPNGEILSLRAEEDPMTAETGLLKKRPMKLKDLLKTRLLEGLAVRYQRGPKTRTTLDVSLQGTISGTGILCSCQTCGGKEVVSPNKFEVHAGSGNKRPAEYIYMPNGRNLRDVLNLCRDVPLQNIKSAVLNFIRCISKDPLPPKGILNESEDDCSSSVMGECNPPQILENSEPSEGVVIGSENEASLPVASPLPPPPSLPVKKPLKSKPTGKLTKKDLRFHKLVFSEHVIPDGTPVIYRVGEEVVLSGHKKGSAIVCSCCHKEHSPSQFENHAGRGTRRKPYLHIFAMGLSLHELAVKAKKTRIISDEDKDDICSICRGGDGVGGGLISCSSCPRVFHTVCQVLPANLNDDWHCRYCLNSFQTERCTRVLGTRVRDTRVLGTRVRDTRVLGTRVLGTRVRDTSVPEADDGRPGGCTLCRKDYFNKKGFGPRTVMLCDQCEKEYHVGCLKKHKMFDFKELPAGVWLCCTDCNIIYYALQNLIATGEVNLKESSLSLIRRKIGSETVAGLDIKWRLLSGKITSDETRSLLSKSVSIFHDRFDPIEELRNGCKTDLIPNMVYGNEMTQHEGMYCAVLTVDSIVVCAGVFRIFGTHLAELPLVATSKASEGLGYFQALFLCIEGLLASLKVKVIVLPAAKEAKSIWTNRFGFVEMSDIEEEQYRNQFQLLFFQGTRMLHKPVMEEL